MVISWEYHGDILGILRNEIRTAWDNNGDIHSGNQTCLAGKCMKIFLARKIIYKLGFSSKPCSIING